jgi:hypothetical protein
MKGSAAWRTGGRRLLRRDGGLRVRLTCEMESAAKANVVWRGRARHERPHSRWRLGRGVPVIAGSCQLFTRAPPPLQHSRQTYIDIVTALSLDFSAFLCLVNTDSSIYFSSWRFIQCIRRTRAIVTLLRHDPDRSPQPVCAPPRPKIYPSGRGRGDSECSRATA